MLAVGSELACWREVRLSVAIENQKSIPVRGSTCLNDRMSSKSYPKSVSVATFGGKT